MKELILASSSPRRLRLLEELGYDFTHLAPNFEESRIRKQEPRIYAMVSSFMKAKSIFIRKKEGVVLGFDTIVSLDKEIFGKPRDREEALRILEKLSGRRHEVISGVSILSKAYKRCDYVVSQVFFRGLSRQEIEEYLDTGDYKDKAGAYGIQSGGGDLIKSYEGDLNNIIGLPTDYLSGILQEIL